MSSQSFLSTSSATCCAVCHHPNIDLRSRGCACAFHAKCALPQLLKMQRKGQKQEMQEQVTCEFCKSGSSNMGFCLEPLAFSDLERAIELRSVANEGKSNDSPNVLKVRAASAVYIAAGGFKGDEESMRTGRWTKEEVDFMDYLEEQFDQGELAIPEGSKLGAFLGDILLCRTSRLTKKRKRAKLSARSFELSTTVGKDSHVQDCKILFALQEKFIATMSSESSKLELRFNLSKQWRTYFSDLCRQKGYAKLDAIGWMTSVEELEERVSASSEQLRTLERRQLRGSFFHGSNTPPPASPALSAMTAPNTTANATKSSDDHIVSPSSSCASPEDIGDDFDINASLTVPASTTKSARRVSSMAESSCQEGPLAKRQRLDLGEDEFSNLTWSSMDLFSGDLEEDPISYFPSMIDNDMHVSSSSFWEEDARILPQYGEELLSYHPEPSPTLKLADVPQSNALPPPPAYPMKPVASAPTPQPTKEPTEPSSSASLKKMITILGDELMNNAPTTSPMESVTSNGVMSLRLLLLTSEARRSTQDNELVHILERSFDAHILHGRRTESEIAQLLAQEFALLKMSLASTGATTSAAMGKIPSIRQSSFAQGPPPPPTTMGLPPPPRVFSSRPIVSQA